MNPTIHIAILIIINLKNQQDPAFLMTGRARHVPHTEDHGRLVFDGVRTETMAVLAPIQEFHWPSQILSLVVPHGGKV